MRILLINPPSPERLGAPLLGLQYVAAALLAHGCEVRVIDAAARFFPHDEDWIVDETRRFDPGLVGMGLFTRWVWHAYRLASRLRPVARLMIGGGPHATVRPGEVLDQGFDIAVEGEAEVALVATVRALQHGRDLTNIPGVHTKAGNGPPRQLISDLDNLPLPQTAAHLFDASWYDTAPGVRMPGGVLTSRGCPSRCTFCANYVTGRTFRYRTAQSVVSELNGCQERFGTCFFPFWDDALTANRARLRALCAALQSDIRFPLQWSAITRANMTTRELLASMRLAGCIGVSFGVESGDAETLRLIGKGLSAEQVVRALEWAKESGLTTTCTFMFGFPRESTRQVEATLRFMERISPLVDTFGTLGVVVPFPGTPLYEGFHRPYGFTDWWLREEFSRYEPPPDVADRDQFRRYYVGDRNLDLNFFHYSPEKRELIRECLRFKAEHNLRKMGLLAEPASVSA